MAHTPNPSKRVTEKGGNTNIAMTDDQWNEKQHQPSKQQAIAGGDGSRDEDRAGRTVDGKYYTPQEWRARQGGSAPSPAIAGGGMGATPTSATAALEGLQGAAAGGPSQPNVSMSGGGGPVDLPGVGMLRQGLGTRIYPEMYSALAGLKRVY